MKTIFQIREFSRRLIFELVDKDKVKLDDILYLKSLEGNFPRKLVGDKEVPYMHDDIFILFDVITTGNIDPEHINDSYRSLLPYNIIVNIYGIEAENIIQYMIYKLRLNKTFDFLYLHNTSILNLPEEAEVLDGIENNQYWIRRRLVLEMNTIQEIIITDNDKDIEIEHIIPDTNLLGE